MMLSRVIGRGLAAASFALMPAMAADLDALVENCNGCHGDNGVSQWDDIPTIAGLSVPVHEDALFIYMDEARPCAESEYRQGDTSRPATTMCAIAAELDDEGIEALAAYYAEQTFVPFKQEFDAGKVQAGKAVHDEACDKCHSDGGGNPDDDAGILAGQPLGYLRATFDEYMSGAREQPKSMKDKMDELSEDDIEALVHYYASQQ